LEKYYNETFSKLQSIVNPQAAKAA
jgi:hypothetical protein